VYYSRILSTIVEAVDALDKWSDSLRRAVGTVKRSRMDGWMRHRKGKVCQRIEVGEGDTKNQYTQASFEKRREEEKRGRCQWQSKLNSFFIRKTTHAHACLHIFSSINFPSTNLPRSMLTQIHRVVFRLSSQQFILCNNKLLVGWPHFSRGRHASPALRRLFEGGYVANPL